MNRTATEKAVREFVDRIVEHNRRMFAQQSAEQGWCLTVGPTQESFYEFIAKELETYRADIFERACGQDATLANLLTNICQILDVVKGEWGEAWSAWDQEQRDACSRWLLRYYGMNAGKREEHISLESKLTQSQVDTGKALRLLDEARTRIIELERACGETAWVSVRLPEEDARVLVWNKAVKDWEIATLDRGRFIDDTGTQTELTDVVTYWAALPSPPTGRTEEK